MSSLSPNANMPFTFFVVLVCWSAVLLTYLWHLLQKCSVLTVHLLSRMRPLIIGILLVACSILLLLVLICHLRSIVFVSFFILLLRTLVWRQENSSLCSAYICPWAMSSPIFLQHLVRLIWCWLGRWCIG
jgi:hypothetical protein